MQIVQIPKYYIRKDLVLTAIKALQQGKLIAFPTDTTWAFCCDPFDRSAVQKLQNLRMRMAGSPQAAKAKTNRPLSLMCVSIKQVSNYVLMSQSSFRLTRRLLPGSYTVILPSSREVPRLLRSKRKTVGIRIPNHPLCNTIVSMLGNPLMTSTARDLDGKLISSAAEIERFYTNEIEVLLESDPISPQPSTVVDITNDYPILVRAGRGEIDPSWEKLAE